MTSVEFRWLLDCSQVACGLGDHFATTVAHLSPKCVLSVDFSFHLSVFRFTRERLNTSKKNNNIKTHPASSMDEWRGERMIAMKYPKFYFC